MCNQKMVEKSFIGTLQANQSKPDKIETACPNRTRPKGVCVLGYDLQKECRINARMLVH